MIFLCKISVLSTYLREKILFDGKPVHYTLQNKLSSLFRVRVSGSVIPANSEVILPGYICIEDNEIQPRLAIVESTEGISSKGLLLARAVVAPSSHEYSCIC